MIGSDALAKAVRDILQGREHRGEVIDAFRAEVNGSRWHAVIGPHWVTVVVETFDGKRNSLRVGSATPGDLFDIRVCVELYYWLARVSVSRVLS